MTNHKVENGTLSIAVNGNILSTGVHELQKRMFSAIDGQDASQTEWRLLHLDLTKATMIDSMGLNLLVSVLKKASERNSKVRIAIRNKNLDRLLKFTRLSEHAEIVHA